MGCQSNSTSQNATAPGFAVADGAQDIDPRQVAATLVQTHGPGGMDPRVRALIPGFDAPFFQAGLAGYSDAAIQAVWDVLVPFAGYAFNKAHSAAYGVVSYWTAYLKANYPTEYMAALLTSVRGDKDKSALYLGECRHMGITVLPPDVNSSAANFTAVGDDIRFGLAAVRNVGDRKSVV